MAAGEELPRLESNIPGSWTNSIEISSHDSQIIPASGDDTVYLWNVVGLIYLNRLKTTAMSAN